MRMPRIGNRICPIVIAAILATGSLQAQPKLQIVTTLTDLADIARKIGGDDVETFAIAAGYQNPHFVDPKPSYILKLTRAEVFITIGLDLEMGWVPALLNSARNADIQPGGKGYIDASENIPLLEVPSNVSREQGDIHIYGNPHYWLDPARVQLIAQNIYEGLISVRPERQQAFLQNLDAFKRRMEEKMSEWNEKMAPFKGTQIIAYHNQWPYFEEAFGFHIVDFLEPKPGIPPTPSQLALVIRRMQQDNLKVLIIAPYYKQDAAKMVVSRLNGTVVALASSVGAFDGVDSIFDLFDYNVDLMVQALRSSTN